MHQIGCCGLRSHNAETCQSLRIICGHAHQGKQYMSSKSASLPPLANEAGFVPGVFAPSHWRALCWLTLKCTTVLNAILSMHNAQGIEGMSNRDRGNRSQRGFRRCSSGAERQLSWQSAACALSWLVTGTSMFLADRVSEFDQLIAFLAA